MSTVMSIVDLLDRAEDALVESSSEETSAGRWLAAHVAASRAAVAVLLTHDRGPSGRPADPWQTLARHSPEFAEWAGYFAEVTSARHGIADGRFGVTPRDADDLLREAETFVGLVATRLGIPRATRHDQGRLAPLRR